MAALREMKGISQNEKNVTRRWFTDDEFWDLYLWYDNDDSLIGFQLCYDRDSGEKALTWKRTEGFLHQSVNPSFLKTNRGGTPLLYADGYFDNENIFRRFREDSGNLDPEIAAFILEKIRSYINH